VSFAQVANVSGASHLLAHESFEERASFHTQHALNAEPRTKGHTLHQISADFKEASFSHPGASHLTIKGRSIATIISDRVCRVEPEIRCSTLPIPALVVPTLVGLVLLILAWPGLLLLNVGASRSAVQAYICGKLNGEKWWRLP